MLKVAHLSCGVTGGADIAAVRVHRALQHAGVKSHFYHLDHASIDGSFTKFYAPAGISSIVRNRVAMYRTRYLFGDQKAGTEAFSNPWGNYPLEFKDLKFPDVDVITLHWIATFIDLRKFFETVPARVKFVWAMHDLNPITGGCHYTNGCRKFETGCVKCPQLTNTGIIDLALRNFRIKKDVYQKYLSGRCEIISNSQWMAKEIKSSALLPNEPVTTVHFPIETEVFKMHDRQTVRELLGIDKNKFVLLFGSGSLDNRRKGMDLMIDALSRITEQEILDRIQLITFGGGSAPKLDNRFPVHHFGKVMSPEFLSQLYNAADFLVTPSREEALGQTAMESVCCGTPVIAFNVGGVPDTINESNGVLAETVDSNSLAMAISKAYRMKFERKSISDAARTRYDLGRKSKEYLDVYKKLMITP